MDENKKRDYSDFFRPTDEENRKNREEEAYDEERPSYYYSYGPYKSAPHSQPSSSMLEQQENPAYKGEGQQEAVEVTSPRPVKPYPYDEQPRGNLPVLAGSMGPTREEPRRRTSFKSMFAAFMAGAVLVGSLMVVSDRMNLFTGDTALSSSAEGPSVSVATANGSGSSSAAGITGAALDIARPNSVSSIVQMASPAVVKIDTYVTSQSRSRTGSNPLFNDPFFRYFFGDQGAQTNPGTGSRQQAGMGTGFVFEKSGYILTNQHVVDGAEEIEVTVEGYDKPFTAKLLGNSFDLDLAVLKIEGEKDFVTLPIGDSSSIKIGDWVVAIGNPYGFDHTVTVGVLSATEREISISETQGTRNYKHLLQTDASINPGNSGGPLLNMNGEVVGINTAVNSAAQGIGFAIPTSTISEVLENLKNNIEIPKEPVPYIGVTLSDIQANWTEDLKIKSTDGALVQDVSFGTPAFRAGLKKYDVITSVDGKTIKNRDELITAIQAKKVGDKVSLGIVRDGDPTTIEVTIGNKNEFDATNG